MKELRLLALSVVAGTIGRQKNLLLKAAPLLLLGPWGKRKIREMVFGPPPKDLPADLQLIADLMDGIGRAAKPRTVKIPRLTDDELRMLAMPILAVVGGRDVLIDSAETRARLEALRIMGDDAAFDLVITDQAMPHMTGAAAIEDVISAPFSL